MPTGASAAGRVLEHDAVDPPDPQPYDQPSFVDQPPEHGLLVLLAVEGGMELRSSRVTSSPGTAATSEISASHSATA